MFHPTVSVFTGMNAHALDALEDGQLGGQVYPGANWRRPNSERFSGEAQRQSNRFVTRSSGAGDQPLPRRFFLLRRLDQVNRGQLSHAGASVSRKPARPAHGQHKDSRSVATVDDPLHSVPSVPAGVARSGAAGALRNGRRVRAPKRVRSMGFVAPSLIEGSWLARALTD